MNPFVALWESPVATLTQFGYALGLLALLWYTLALTWRNALNLYVEAQKQRPQMWEYDPPLWWMLRTGAIPLILMIDAWALGALIQVFG